MIFSTLGFWLDTYGSQKNNLHLSSPVILEKQMPVMSVKHGSLSVKITGINSKNVLIPILSYNSSKNSTTFSSLGFFIKSSKINCKFGRINDKILLLSVLMVPRKSSC